ADRRHALVVVVVVDLDGLHEHLAVGIGDARRMRRRRTRIVGEALRCGRRCRRKLERAREQHAEQQREQRPCRGKAPAIAAHDHAPRQRGQAHLEGGDDCHYPSSWYSKATKPVRPPTTTGNHAAAIGCINSALLKSSVTFDSTWRRKPAPTPLKTIFCTPQNRKKRNDS